MWGYPLLNPKKTGMQAIKRHSVLLLLISSVICNIVPELQAQVGFYKFPVVQEGVYKITAAQASSLGAGSVSELSIFGYNGMLPQQLERGSLELKEIPVKEIGGD